MALTAKAAAAQRRQLRRELEKDARRKDRERLAGLRTLVQRAKQHKRRRLAEIVTMCKRARADNRETAKALRARKRLEANREIEAQRRKSRKDCNRRKLKTRHRGLDSVMRAHKNLESERTHQRTMRVLTRKTPTQRKAARARRADAMQESNSEVEHNIPPELVQVWRKVRKRIKATQRKSRTEAFLEWAAEHKGEVYAITDRELEKDVAALVAEEKAARAESTAYDRMKETELKRRRARKAPKPAAGDDVPF